MTIYTILYVHSGVYGVNDTLNCAASAHDSAQTCFNALYHSQNHVRIMSNAYYVNETTALAQQTYSILESGQSLLAALQPTLTL